ncbi:hypothetical protein GCM10010169_36540 [Micromonospora fulviviridis]|nr:hypothetical protein GCM10010169_36540 [Micromonospora fulviviridis]
MRPVKWTSPAKASRTSTGALGVAVPVADAVGPDVAPRQTGAEPVDSAAHPATPSATAVSAASEARPVLRITRQRVRAPDEARDPGAGTERRSRGTVGGAA